MLATPQIRALVLESLGEILSERQEDMRDLGPDTRLVGRESRLDSLGLVTLIVEIEDRLASRHGLSVQLADERAMSESRSPFRDVDSLVEYVTQVLAHRAH